MYVYTGNKPAILEPKIFKKRAEDMRRRTTGITPETPGPVFTLVLTFKFSILFAFYYMPASLAHSILKVSYKK